VVLFEMLTGRAVFKGKTVSHVLASVLRADPDWNSLPANLHPRIRLLLERCLEKEARNRCHDIADARVDIERVLADPQGVQVHSAAAGASGRRAWSIWSVLVWPMTAAVLAGALVWYLRPAPAIGPAPVVRFPFLLPDSIRITPARVGVIAISPDGTRIAFAANSQLFLWNLTEEQEQAQPVPGTGGRFATMPVFSPDGSALAYVDFETSKGPFIIKRVPVTGGTPVQVFESKTGQEYFTWGLTWPSQEALVFVTSDGVVRIPSNGGGVPDVLVQRAEDEVFESPQILPGGNELLFVRLAGANPGEDGVERWKTAEIVIQSIGKNDRTLIWKGGSHPRYLPTGQVVFAQGNTLFALNIDLDSRKVTAGPVPVLDGIRRSTDGFTDAAQYSISDTGVLVSIPDVVAPAAENGVLALLDRKGVTTPLPVRPAQYRGPRFSPDENQIAVEIVSSTGQSNIGIYDVSDKSEVRYLPQTGSESNTRPIWNIDGKRVTFASNRGGAWGIYEQPVDNSAPPIPLTTAKNRREIYPDNWSPDGKTLVFAEVVTNTNLDLWTLSQNDDKPALLAGEGLSQFGSAFSPDGKWILYTDVTTPFGLRAKPLPLTGMVQQITQDGEAWPIWSGTEVFFRLRLGGNAPPRLRIIEMTTTGGFSRRNVGEVPLPKGTLMYPGYRDYDATRKGDRFVIILSEKKETPAKAAAAPERMNVVLNWPEELRKQLQSP
ncbi:MAG TPA: hypothetical protein VFR18_05340, partial [Terriglobia bacterium]|nr:hypothetical protein [Terriglobia bacterium]